MARLPGALRPLGPATVVTGSHLPRFHHRLPRQAGPPSPAVPGAGGVWRATAHIERGPCEKWHGPCIKTGDADPGASQRHDALMGFRGSSAPPWSEKRTSLLKAIAKEGLQGGKGDNRWVGRHRHIHDPGIQQEPQGKRVVEVVAQSLAGPGKCDVMACAWSLIDKALEGNPAGGLLNADHWRSAARASPLHREEKDMAQTTGV